MPQLHFYLPEEKAQLLKERAARHGMSLSRYLAEVVQREVGEGWPEGYFDSVAGGWEGDPLERPDQGEQEARGTL